MDSIPDEVDALFHEYLTAIEHQHFEESIRIVEKCYCLWIEKHHSQSLATMLASMLIFSLAAELMWITHYSLPTASGLVLMTLTLGIKISTPGMNSFFQCNFMKKKGFFSIPRRLNRN